MILKSDKDFYNKLPKSVIEVLNVLHSHNYEAFIVGGACRNYLLEKDIKDFDITSNATPKQVKKIFENYNVIGTGEAFGTMTVLCDDKNAYEITTYRSEAYTDMSRKPSKVQYEKNLLEDLKRRDFTINCICYDIETKNFMDFFTGFEDLECKLVRSVITPAESYRRDPLRIMRLIRFVCTLDFQALRLETQFIKNNAALLLNISQERITEELNKILVSDRAVMGLKLLYNTCIMDLIIPDVAIMGRFQQNNPAHHDYNDEYYTLLNHTYEVVENVPKNLILRLAALFHDIGKPYCINVRSNEEWGYTGHPIKSAEMVKVILNKMKYSNDIIESVYELIKEHDTAFTIDLKIDRILIKKIMRTFKGNYSLICKWIELKKSDILAHCSYKGKKEKFLIAIDLVKGVVDSIIENKEAYSLKDLCINGDDIISLGFKGKEVGIALDIILDKIILNELPNEKEDIIQWILTQKN